MIFDDIIQAKFCSDSSKTLYYWNHFNQLVFTLYSNTMGEKSILKYSFANVWSFLSAQETGIFLEKVVLYLRIVKSSLLWRLTSSQNKLSSLTDVFDQLLCFFVRQIQRMSFHTIAVRWKRYKNIQKYFYIMSDILLSTFDNMIWNDLITSLRQTVSMIMNQRWNIGLIQTVTMLWTTETLEFQIRSLKSWKYFLLKLPSILEFGD